MTFFLNKEAIVMRLRHLETYDRALVIGAN